MNKKLNLASRFLVLAFVSITLLSAVYFLTKSRIAEQKFRAKTEKFLEISPSADFSKSFLQNPKKIQIAENEAFLYENEGEIFIEATTNKGYSGKITLLIGLNADRKTIKGLRVLEHKETAGLGDKIELEKSPWILSFNGQNLETKKFAVKKDGGDFDAFTGATITPRAVVNLLKEVLEKTKNY